MIITVKGADFSSCGIGKIVTTISDECKEIASHYSRLKTIEDMAVLQQFMDDLGYGVEGGIWSKLAYLFLPIFASTKEEMLYDVKNNITYFLPDDAKFKAVSPWGMSVATDPIASEAGYYRTTVQLAAAKKPCECTSIIVSDISNARGQFGICEPVSGAYSAVNASHLPYINIGTIDEGEERSTVLHLGDTSNLISVDRYIDISGDGPVTGKYKAWTDDGTKISEKFTLRTSSCTPTTTVGVGFGTAYYLSQNSDVKMYVYAYSDLLTETECATMRDALLSMLKSLGIK